MGSRGDCAMTSPQALEIGMLSQTTEYALRAMACLAHAPERLTATPELAKHTSVPPNYLAKVLQQLSAAELITGRRGVGGGYRLAKPADAIKLIDVINAVNPVRRFEISPTAGSGEDQAGVEGSSAAGALSSPDLAPLYEHLDEAATSLIRHFDGTNLSDLVPPAERVPQQPPAATAGSASVPSAESTGPSLN